MLFANPGTATVSREIKGVVYSCAPGDVVDVPDELAWVIPLEGVALVPADKLTAKQDEPAKQDAKTKSK
jgi:hypothetical protein